MENGEWRMENPTASIQHSPPLRSGTAPASCILHPASCILPHLSLGIILGLGLLTKASAIGLLPLAVATVAWETWQQYKLQIANHKSQITENTHHLPFAIYHLPSAICYLLFAICHLLLVILPALALSGWWFYRNFRLYGDWLGLNAFYAVLGTRDVTADFAQLWAERFAFAAGYWGNFGGLNVPLPTWIYTLLNAIAILTFIKIIVKFGKWATGWHQETSDGRQEAGGRKQEAKGKNEEWRMRNGESYPPHPKSKIQNPKSRIPNLWPFAWDALTAARALAWAWPAAVFVSWIRWATITWSSQGRLIFSAIPMWSLALALPIRKKDARNERQGARSKRQEARGKKQGVGRTVGGEILF